MDLDIGRSLDRISKLPDSVLCHILLFLSTKYAVRTSILSTRWQYLWTYVATLEFDDREHFDGGPPTDVNGEVEVNLSFTNFVNTVLLLSDVSCLEKFSLKLESFYNLDILKAWISTAIKRNVQKLELCYSVGRSFDQLPRMLFNCKTLMDLRLVGNISLKVPATVWLPSLKILEIEKVRYENEDSAHKLIHGCPVLEDLHIYSFYVDKQKVLNISVPTLKRLILNRQRDGTHVLSGDLIDESQHELIVNTPKLEVLYLIDNDTDEFSLENLSSLLEARISVGFCFSGLISSSNLLKLLHGIANVKFLGGNRFLRSSSRLWSPPPAVPSCLLLNLKEIEYIDFRGDDHEFKVIEYFLKSAEVLKNVTIGCQHSDSWRVLARFPRASKICELNLR